MPNMIVNYFSYRMKQHQILINFNFLNNYYSLHLPLANKKEQNDTYQIYFRH